MKPQSRRNAFTLVELLAVVIIMAIMITIGAMSLPRMTRVMAVNRGGQQIVNALEYARQLAITDRIPTRVVFRGNRCIVFVSNAFYASSYAIGQNACWVKLQAYQGGGSWDGGDVSRLDLPAGSSILSPSGGSGAGGYSPWPATHYGYNSSHMAWLEMSKTSLDYDPDGSGGVPSTNIYSTSGFSVKAEATGHYWVNFDRYGLPDITATVVVTEASSSTGVASTTSSNRFIIYLQKGSRNIRTWRP